MLRTTCAACGGALQRAQHNTAVCMKCFRTYEITSNQLQAPNPAFQRAPKEQPDNQARLGLIFICAVLGMIFACCDAPLLAAIMVIQTVRQCVHIAKHPEPDTAPDGIRSVACGEYLKTRGDYTRALRDLPIGTMPLGLYAERAALQIENLARKQQGFLEILGSNHPYLKNCAEAEAYILANCKKVLWRLKYCDQSDPRLCRLHAEFLQGVLDDNDRVLRDYEHLLIEVTQMDDDLPQTAPSLDVLADTLHSMRTGERLTDIHTIEAMQ